ncbi:MAG: hypothetical protein Q9208_000664 [Pyrenodesmia sp. 3 TL-2023]
MSSGKKLKPTRAVKTGTLSKKKHRFESFNQRVAKLNIDPIHKCRSAEKDLNEDDPAASYFKSDLDKWKDLNLSENFADFVREVSPLCNTLPQVLHYHGDISRILANYIKKGDNLSLEPLLSLLASFAHDLAARFESHFSDAITLVTSIAAKHTDVAVIEWSFNCLAWLFKYLSRLLVPDLRPLLQIMSPVLGKESQKLFTVRFAAESLSFLLRKAALVHHKNQKPLENAIGFVLDDVDQLDQEGKDTPLYYYGLKILLIDAMRGIDRGLHSSGPTLYGFLVDNILSRSGKGTTRLNILEGVTVGLIHHTEASTFRPLLDHFLRRISYETRQRVDAQIPDHAVRMCERLLCVMSTVRKGSRVQDWGSMLDALVELLNSREEHSEKPTATLFETAVIIMQSASLDVLLPKTRPVMDRIANDHNQDYFLIFCDFFCKLDKERFESLIHPYFVKFLNSRWRTQRRQLCLTLPKVGKGGKGKVICPAAWQTEIVASFQLGGTSSELLSVADCYNYLRALSHVTVPMSTTDAVMQSIRSMIQSTLVSPATIDSNSIFSLGAGLKAYAEYEANHRSNSPKIWQSVLIAAAHYKTLPSFLESILISLKSEELVPEAQLEGLVEHMVENLHSSSHVLRELSLQIINVAYEKACGNEAAILSTALAIEKLPLDLKSARISSMYIRKLATQYKDDNLHPWLRKATPHFCFGIHTFKLSPVWEDSIEVLKQICDTPQGEEIVSDLAFQMLEVSGRENESADSGIEQPQRKSLEEFECSNLNDMDVAFHDCLTQLTPPKEETIKTFASDHTMSQGKVTNAPAIALRVLLGIPKIAEKRSRGLVPVFLRWAILEEVEDPQREESSSPSTIEENNVGTLKLGGPDRKAMLRLFGLFNNPKVLYRSVDVFDALRNLLANGDIEIQKLALNAIFTWKIEALQPYQESLLNLLDEARFRDEITTFLEAEDQGNRIQDEHRSQLIPILLRLLYGKLVSRAGNQSAQRTQNVKRKVVLQALSKLSDAEIQDFLSIALGPVVRSQDTDEERRERRATLSGQMTLRKQVGLLHMVRDMLTTLGTRLKPFTIILAVVTIDPLAQACQLLASEKPIVDGHEGSQVSMLKDIRQMGLQCVNLLFQHCTISDIQPRLPILFAEAIDPRLGSLPVDTAQSVSGLLQLFATWASARESALFLVGYNASLLESISSCLEVQFAKDEVRMFVLENILKPLIQLVRLDHAQSHDPQQSLIINRILHPNNDILLTHLGGLVRTSPSKELLASAIDCITQLAPFVQGSSQIKNIVELASFLLTQPSQRVSPRTKGDLLQILQHLMPQHDFTGTPETRGMIFATISSLFAYFKDRKNRVTLVKVFVALAEQDGELGRVAALCKSLNSYSASKIDEPDFDDRLQAFSTINEREHATLMEREWRPILYNMLFFIRDTEELAIRSSASFALRRFVEANRINTAGDECGSDDLTKNVLLPALRKGVSETSELVRSEYLAVMAHVVRLNPDWHEVCDMSVLLVSDDDEASFFSNILHIQQHRRLRALRRLATEARHGRLHSNNVAHFFLPLIEHFVFDKADDESAHNLSSETVNTIGALALCLEWPQFRAVFRRYLGYIESKPDLEKSIIKLVGVLADSLSAAMESGKGMSSTAEAEVNEDRMLDSQPQCMLLKTLPRIERLAEDLTKNIFPAMTKYLHEKDESAVSLRVPVAVSAVKLLKVLPPSHIEDRLPPILTDVCNILRSRAQESRDLTRKTLVDIAVVVGPAYFGFILKELRRALARGYQLHVLSYTVHSILVETGPVYQLGDLDYCLSQIVAVIMDDIFGATGQEKDAEEYISKMKEVKSSKSYDSMEIVARSATTESFLHLVRPLQSLLDERLDLKLVRKIDELLRRIGIGLLHNQTIQSRQVLIFCHEIIREVYQAEEQHGRQTSGLNLRNKRFLVSKGVQKSHRGSTSSFRYKLVRFAFDLLRSVLHRYDSLQTPANLAGFMPMLGDAMVQSNEEIRMSAIRLLTSIIKVPLPEIDSNAAVYVTEAVKIVKASPSTSTELAQAAVKLVSAILRERRDVEVRETDLTYLLKRIQPDLEELDRQGVAFNLLKAVMTRRIVIVEVYEVLETVSSMMVTSQTRGSRDQARSVYFDFLIRYPQGKGRFNKQLSFLAKNLDYKHQEGRQSVMEAVHLLLSKLGDDLLQPVLETFFVPLVMVLVNDESNQCREMAGALLKTILERADPERRDNFLSLLRSWLLKQDQTLLVRLALQVYSIYLESQGKSAEKELPFLFGQLARILEGSTKDKDDADWELLYYALQTFAKACQTCPVAGFAANTVTLWACVRESLSFPHLWVKKSAAKLQGLLFADFARTNADDDQPELPLHGSGGLRLTGLEMEQITRASLAVFKIPTLTEELATQTVRNLIFLAKMMNSTSWDWGSSVADTQLPSTEEPGDQCGNDEDEASDADVGSQIQKKSGLQFIIQRASTILRRGPLTTSAPSLIPLKATISLLSALCTTLPPSSLTAPILETLLLPLHNLTDPSIPAPSSSSSSDAFVTGYRALVAHAAELMALLQKKLGTTEYVARLGRVREGVRGRREGRRVKRRIEAVAEVEKWGREKVRKGERKRERRREKSEGQRSRRRGW